MRAGIERDIIYWWGQLCHDTGDSWFDDRVEKCHNDWFDDMTTENWFDDMTENWFDDMTELIWRYDRTDLMIK